MTSATAMFSDNVVISDLIAWVLTLGITVSLLKLLEQTATRGVFEQKSWRLGCVTTSYFRVYDPYSNIPASKYWILLRREKLNRKLLHISFGLVFLLCWPMFSSGHLGAIVASLIPAMNVINMLLLGLGIWKDDATVKSMTRNGDIRYMMYFRWFGYMEGSSVMVVRFLVVSIACALVESHPISTLLDDNFTLPLVVVLLGTLLF